MILIVSKNNNKVLESIQFLFDQERIEYNSIKEFDKSIECEKIIYITEEVEKISSKNDILIISSQKINLKDYKSKVNLIITDLINDNNNYTMAQEEYLFRKGIYRIINDVVLDFINDVTIDKMIYDTSSCELQPTDWVFKFDSISESYAWLSTKNQHIENARKVIEISSSSTFNDSDKEINYLSEYILLAKKGMKIYNLFIGTKEDIEQKKQNKFFDILARKSGDNVKTFFIDINVLEKEDPDVLEKFRDGIAIYDDCVYRDTFDDEFSLGVVDCKLESVKEYDKLFDYVQKKYAKEIVVGGEYVGF